MSFKHQTKQEEDGNFDYKTFWYKYSLVLDISKKRG